MLPDKRLPPPIAVRRTKKALLNGFKYLDHHKGTCFVEIIGNCPSNWKMTPLESMKFIEEEMVKHLIGRY